VLACVICGLIGVIIIWRAPFFIAITLEKQTVAKEKFANYSEKSGSYKKKLQENDSFQCENSFSIFHFRFWFLKSFSSLNRLKNRELSYFHSLLSLLLCDQFFLLSFQSSSQNGVVNVCPVSDFFESCYFKNSFSLKCCGGLELD
jgi:hypothetical protein